MTTFEEVSTLKDYHQNERASSVLPYCIFHDPFKESTGDEAGYFGKIDYELTRFFHNKWGATNDYS